ncbi:1-phosphofructokinase family hexose kinase [Paenibacillus sp. J22TS3]|uniref:1-phosphofructokinase family hexose kinase n=1 Tax=Paenibacillus sp. J22TS3 TaxID=2807192 RepID=UPI001B233340|nr:1-phosphofructokinase family hexose kinase [Paenibacillus sp. J22TS3]GIP23452.1 tagatose-6-phosphate kinase [Paenibacillus sp. J22TS3]
MTPRILTVTLNAAIDKTYYMNGWSEGEVMRALEVKSRAGGKGINVARVLHQLGQGQVTVTGFAAGYNGQFIMQAARQDGLIPDFITVNGESRLCLNFMNKQDYSSTEVLEPGPLITLDDEEAMKKKFAGLAQAADLVIISGSVPKGCRPQLYTELISLAKSSGTEVFLDASGQPLVEGMKAAPALIKPNEDEINAWLCQTSGGNAEAAASNEPKARTAQHYAEAAQLMVTRTGISRVIVTMGAQGALAAAGGRLYRIRIPRVEAVNPVGSGDAFVAGYAYGYVRDWPEEECLRSAAAAGSANALNPEAGCLTLSDYEHLLGEVTVDIWTDTDTEEA